MTDVLIAFIEYALGPLMILGATWYLNRLNDKRAEVVKKALQQTTMSNSLDHGSVVLELQEVKKEITEHRAEFSDYRTEHAREHQLINRIIAR